jgi:hypothetical protein
VSSRRERRLGYLERSYARMMERLADVTRAMVLLDHRGAERNMGRLFAAAESMAESLAALVSMPPRQRRPHRRPNARARTYASEDGERDGKIQQS